MDRNSVIVVAPHPDDEVLGCGGVIKRLSAQGHKVYILIVTRGRKELYSEERIQNVRQEALDAHRILGVTESRFLDFPAPDLDMISIADLSMAIQEVILEFKCDTLFLPHRGDIHHDHKAVFNAGIVAARPTRTCSVKTIYSYETLSETEWAAPFSDDAFIPTRFVNITSELNAKLDAMRCFKSQLQQFPSSRSIKSLEALASYRGSTVGYISAEAFMTIRILND